MFHAGDARGELNCSFCGKKQADVRKLVAGPGVYICDECAELVLEIVEEEDRRASPPSVPSAEDVASTLLSRLSGESIREAAVQLGSIVARHLAGARPGHVLLIGPTGSGKTALIEALKASVPLPVAVVDMSLVTETGYSGTNPCECLRALLQAAEYDVKRAQRGIIVLDHFDLVDHKGDPRLSVQREFLSQLEGAVVEVLPRESRREGIPFDTSDLLYIACGIFEEQGMASPGSLEALSQWGLVRPLLARIPHRVLTPAPTASDLEAILVRDGGPLDTFKASRSDLTITADAPAAIATLAASLHLGAWGLRHVLAALGPSLADGDLLDSRVVERARLLRASHVTAGEVTIPTCNNLRCDDPGMSQPGM